MFSFLLGFGAAFYCAANGPAVRRTFARAVLTGYDLAVSLGRSAHRGSLELKEDMEDAFAEVRAERAAQTSSAFITPDAETLQRIQSVRCEIASLRSEIPSA